MEAITSALASIDWVVVAQLASVALVLLSGPLVIFLLSASGGDL
ncbi:MAG: photosystem II reaction center protein Ycf12 [Cyanobacteria bacterium QS_8_64_29]|jgi:hypothetical protein|nr:MAG: photosystem II reaction center protein Ycf12 [Cyanobacteria bacterium QS_8_64_29]